jgi:hypothetical protein
VIQILKDPEILENDENILLFSLRNREKQSYEDMREGKFAGKSIAELKNFVLTTIYPDLEGKSVEIAKHVPHEF